ncbi:hypothetical protein TNCV_3216151 [Trichonephila clavipes]|nr:hypothetical protein TNCV_3216151 [Trichonephila clavipes]
MTKIYQLTLAGQLQSQKIELIIALRNKRAIDYRSPNFKRQMTRTTSELAPHSTLPVDFEPQDLMFNFSIRQVFRSTRLDKE